jgi:hypothetical protein
MTGGITEEETGHRAESTKEGSWHERFRAEHRRTRGQSTEEPEARAPKNPRPEEGKGPEITLGKTDDRREHREENRPGESIKEGTGKETRARKSKRDRRAEQTTTNIVQKKESRDE